MEVGRDSLLSHQSTHVNHTFACEVQLGELEIHFARNQRDHHPLAAIERCNEKFQGIRTLVLATESRRLVHDKGCEITNPGNRLYA
ncbi:hypothetical protein TI01_1461 [Lysobacter sp. A03]|nr:hypothetical protein TI01_1461 [Lysobacter sp. A03]